MRILYIYRKYKDRRKKYGEMMERCGHEVIYVEKKDKFKNNQFDEKIIKKYKPDLVWFLNFWYVVHNPSFVDYLNKKKIPIVVYATYNPTVPYPDWDDIYEKIDHLFVHSKDMNEYLVKNNFNSHYMPIGFYSDQYFYNDVNNKNHDISFCGSVSIPPKTKTKDDDRIRYLRSLGKYNLVVYGNSFKNKLGKIPVIGYKNHEQQRKAYWNSKINLDVGAFFSGEYHNFYKNKYHIKNRFFEIPATKGFMLTVKCDEYLEIFPEDTVGYYDANIESLKENVNKYLKDDSLRIRMAEKAHKLVYQKHMYLHRFQEMFKLMEM